MTKPSRLLPTLALLLPTLLHAAGLEVQPLTKGVWALVGEMDQRSPQNLGNNATFGVIDTADGLVLVDPGGSYKGAEQIAAAIKTFSTKPVVLVIDTGGQDHRWLGNGYWRERGARLVASAAAVADQQARQQNQQLMLQQLVGKAGMAGTVPVYADETFDKDLDLTVGGVRLELHHYGPAHTAGDAVVWLPASGVLFTGDIVFTERMLGVGAQSDIKGWIAAFAELRKLPVKQLVPGHGHVTDLATAERDTGRYLTALRDRVGAFIAAGGGLADIHQVDQSDFMYLKAADQLAGRNAHQVFQQLEFDF
jgi:glyoxylase-like metal-dependent hydrolase (beta-lactamase superfamily II)